MITGPQIDDWKQAYDLLDAPYASSPREIKQAYRRLTKRWHPDRYRSGTPEQAEATQMMERINEAHSKIADAPLRFFVQKQSARQAPPEAARTPSHSDLFAHMYAQGLQERMPALNQPFDLCVRFIVGALLGAFVALCVLILLGEWLGRYPTVVVVVCLSIVLAGGFLMAKRGASAAELLFFLRRY